MKGGLNLLSNRCTFLNRCDRIIYRNIEERKRSVMGHICQKGDTTQALNELPQVLIGFDQCVFSYLPTLLTLFLVAYYSYSSYACSGSIHYARRTLQGV